VRGGAAERVKITWEHAARTHSKAAVRRTISRQPRSRGRAAGHPATRVVPQRSTPLSLTRQRRFSLAPRALRLSSPA